MRTIALILIANFCAAIPVAAQSYTLKGKVVNEQQQPVANASLQVLNTSVIKSTAPDGSFLLQITSRNTEIMFSHINYASVLKKLPVGDTNLLVILPSKEHKLSEIIVIANRKEQPLRETPVSVTALSEEKIRQAKIWSINDLTGIVPNFRYADLGVGYQSQIAIRGVSIFSETPATATYIDGVAALDVSATGLQLANIASIEVLRGPQGTLYGRNAMAGVINITTRKPADHPTEFAEASIGNMGLQRYSAGLTLPSRNKKFHIGASGQYEKWKGFYTNDLSEATVFDPETKERYSLKGTAEDGVRVGDEESYYVNLSLNYKLSKYLQLSLNNIFQEQHSVGASSYYMAVPTNVIALQKPYKFTVNDLGTHQRKYASSSLNGIYNHTGFTITNTIAIQYILQAYHHIDQDLLPDNAAYGSSFSNKVGDPYPQTVFSEELRIQSKSHSRVQWTAGLYYFNQNLDKQYAAVYKDLALLLGMQPGTQITRTDFSNKGVALYGQAEYEFLSKWKITGGIRADHESRNIGVSLYYLNDNSDRNYDIPDTTKKSSYTALSPKLTTQYNLSENQFLYMSFTRGFRAGGNNLLTKDRYVSYDPEYSNNYEVGYKLEAWDKKLRLSTSLFYLYWKNMQLDLNPEPGVWIIDNVGNVTSYGLV